MAEFFTTRGLSYHIDEIIKNGDDFVILVTPYLKFSKTLYERLKSLVDNNVELSIVYGKTQLTKEQERLINQLGCNIFFKENLHAKCYINQSDAVICSMNLHSFSEVNNIEMGVKLDKRRDKSAYVDCLSEVQELIKNSQALKITKKVTEETFQNTNEKYTNDEFIKEWYMSIKQNFKDFDFTLEGAKIITSKTNFEKFTLTNDYGFITIVLKGNPSFLKLFRNVCQNKILENLDNYRCYWSHPYNKIFLYQLKGIEFSNIQDDIDYCLKGTKILIYNLKSTVYYSRL
ncbi:phospholipase D-like domain-containing protein [Ancylomarina sp. 16SWW S1-10-2]|uniref:phospholipase D-like domain-containing protein n=1 Tax=Ancylomarina sp. 16SWW S1-10-2 TaxID=2499681 RepID=UPI0012AE2B18|nr:phospholipase D-like domain-containing protein [Ancylomarina sp. 16SWW S1-10-2]MRT93035.1 hypothetical protein [Ancylomarina sp. 16SWW S1-10-2]